MSETYTPPIGNVRGDAYLEVKHRVYWVRQDHKDAQIITDLISHDAEHGYAVVKAIVTLPSTGAVGTGYGMAERGGPGPAAKRYIEFAETRAIGRACAAVGYGTLAALEEDSDPADAPASPRPREQPQEPRNGRQATPSPPQPARAASPPAGVGSESVRPALATEDQQAQIRRAVTDLGWGKRDADAYLFPLNVARFSELTPAQAEAVIEDLQAKAAKVQVLANVP
jgi:hypothetical protein